MYISGNLITNVEEPNCRKANFPDRNANTDGAEKAEVENLTIPMSWPLKASFCDELTHGGWKYKIEFCGSSDSVVQNRGS